MTALATPSDLGRYAAAFERDGFLVVPGLFEPAEMRAVKEEIAAILEAARREAAGRGEPPESAVRGGVFVGLSAASLGARCRALARDPRLLDILAAVYARNIEFLSDKVALKSDRTDFGTPWHQDWPYWHGSHKVSVWVSLDDATVANGCMKLLRGSHRAPVSHEGGRPGDEAFNQRLRPGEVDEERAVTAEVPAGGAVFFHDLTLHASHPNTARQDRWAWVGTYRDARADEPDYAWAVAREVVRGSRSEPHGGVAAAGTPDEGDS